MPAPLVHRHLLLGRFELDQLGLEPLHREDLADRSPLEERLVLVLFLFLNLTSPLRVTVDVIALLVRVLHIFEKLASLIMTVLNSAGLLIVSSKAFLVLSRPQKSAAIRAHEGCVPRFVFAKQRM